MQRTGKRQNARELSRLDARLDAALSATFPASDPIAVGRPTATERLTARGDERTTVAEAGKAAAGLPAEQAAGRGGKVHAAKAHAAKVRGP